MNKIYVLCCCPLANNIPHEDGDSGLGGLVPKIGIISSTRNENVHNFLAGKTCR